ncbi:MAG: acyl--CoA ligase [Deltaproteobacteria bacterium]|nr:acyl--CoA ligase [Deltaproteobacteria bacterium]
MTEIGRDGTYLEKIQDIISGPVFPEKKFLDSGTTYRQIYGMAADIRSRYDDENKTVCIAVGNRAVMAASVLSALSGGPALVLPYSNSPKVLSETYFRTRYSAAIVSSADVALPRGVEHIVPEPGNGSWESGRYDVNPDKPFITLFTGGSTGIPRTWSKTPVNLLGEAIHTMKRFNISSSDRVAATVSPYHIYGLLFSVLIPLVSSASVLEETFTFPGEIISAIEKKSASILVSVPVHYRALEGHSIKRGNLLRLAFSSAGALDKDDGRYFFEQTGVGVTEVYGSTETGGIALRNRSLGEESLAPFDMVDWKISEDRLYVRSAFLSPELERDRDGYFRTGDRAACADGKITLLGRVDGIVKVGGRRVDLEDIRKKIKNINGITDAFVFSRPAAGGRENEIAAAVETLLGRKEILKKLSTVVEPYALPRRIRNMKKIPVTKTGKYDRKALSGLFDQTSKSIV